MTPREFESRLREVIFSRDAVCPRCGYNLSGLRSSRCPECGKNVTEALRMADLSPHRVRRDRIARDVKRIVGGAVLFAAGVVVALVYMQLR